MADTGDFWDQKRKTPFRWIVSALMFTMIYGGFMLLLSYRHTDDTRAWLLFNYSWFLELLIVTTVHELGHMAVARALGFRFLAINIGPLTVSKDAYGHRHVRFEWNRLTGNGGYAASVPTSEDHIRSNMIVMIFAGPFASLNAAFLCWFLYLQLPGTAWEQNWFIPGGLAILFASDFIVNLIPIGFCDGTMLLHLILWTKHGQDLYAFYLAGKTSDDASRQLVSQDFSSEVALRQKALDQLLAQSDSPSLQLGHSYQALGIAQTNHFQKRESISNLKKSLDIFELCRSVDPIHEANTLSVLEHNYRALHFQEEAQQAADSALVAFEKSRAKPRDRLSKAAIQGEIARLHVNSRRYQLAFDAIEQALDMLPSGPQHWMQTASIVQTKMRCEAGIGAAERAEEALSLTIEILRSHEVPQNDRTQAASQLGSLAVWAWLAGVGNDATELLAESIRSLERLGGTGRAESLKVALADVLREQQRLAEAEAALPPEADMKPEHLDRYFGLRAEIFADTGRIDLALADVRQEIALIEGEPGDHAIELASAWAKLAEYLFNAGNAQEAADWARQAAAKLLPRRHPEASRALLVQALLASPENSGPLLEQAKDLIRSAPFLEGGSKARALEDLTRRYGRSRHEEFAGVPLP